MTKRKALVFQFLTGIVVFLSFIFLSVFFLVGSVEKLFERGVFVRVGSALMTEGIQNQLKKKEDWESLSVSNQVLIRPFDAFDFEIPFSDLQNKSREEIMDLTASLYWNAFYEIGPDFLREMTHDPHLRKYLDLVLDQTSDPEYFSPAYLHRSSVIVQRLFLVFSFLSFGLLFVLARKSGIFLSGLVFILTALPGLVFWNFSFAFSTFSLLTEDLFGTLGIQGEALFRELAPVFSEMRKEYFLIFLLGVFLVLLSFIFKNKDKALKKR